MNNLKEINKNFKIKSCSYIKNIKIINTLEGIFVVKEKKQDNDNLYAYLEAKNFHNYLSPYLKDDRYYIYPYIDSVNISYEEKAYNMVYIISMLHNKTTFYKNIELDTIKEIYEDINNKLNYISNYYNNIKLITEENNYISPSSYLLLRNSTLIYQCIDLSKYFIDKWYNLIKNKKSFRVATIHNNLELDHLLIDNNSYLISWDKSCKASPIYDLVSLYKNTYDKISFDDLFNIYNSKYPLLEEECYLLFATILIPDRIDLSKREIINSKEVYLFTNYLISTLSFTSKYYTKEANSKTQ